ncbi:MAG: hypothetical protein UZ21_OP11001000035 [Microgenomates bacterium OLB22]|nr:MAG: hypothetical protein UZ21_OP11001000035 [Microgenomates bacterium OLB22]
MLNKENVDLEYAQNETKVSLLCIGLSFLPILIATWPLLVGLVLTSVGYVVKNFFFAHRLYMENAF